ncbi:hypothetical protein D9M68_485080 [compost metagenome]
MHSGTVRRASAPRKISVTRTFGRLACASVPSSVMYCWGAAGLPDSRPEARRDSTAFVSFTRPCDSRKRGVSGM